MTVIRSLVGITGMKEINPTTMQVEYSLYSTLSPFAPLFNVRQPQRR
jgi:hypothetical protein